jgi:hypothetical protein
VTLHLSYTYNEFYPKADKENHDKMTKYFNTRLERIDGFKVFDKANRYQIMAYRTFDKIRQVDQGAISDNKRLGAVLAMIRGEQLRRGPERRSGPRRRDQSDARLFKVG